MSCASDVKTELCRGKLSRKCCAQAEACGVLLYCNQFSLQQVKIVTESPAFSQRLSPLFHKAFGLSFDEKGDPGGSGKRIDVSIRQEILEAVIQIRDYGPGVPVEELPFIKNKFYKGSSKARFVPVADYN